MSVGKKREVVETWICDSCGEEFWERKGCSLVFKADGDITFEWWNTGDYCPECLLNLANGITNAIPVAERYEKSETKIPKELAVIRGEMAKGE